MPWPHPADANAAVDNGAANGKERPRAGCPYMVALVWRWVHGGLDDWGMDTRMRMTAVTVLVGATAYRGGPLFWANKPSGVR
jgi:hypothetical protein